MNIPNHLPAPQEESNSTDIVPQSHAPEGTVWSKSPGSEVMPIVEGVRLGSLGDGKFKDEHFQQVPDMGITVGVEQASYGFTGISAEALPGFRVDALRMAKDGSYTWEGPPDHTRRVWVNADWGNMQSLPAELWQADNLGNPGNLAGIIRIYNEEQDTARFFGMGADFRGKPDSWLVGAQMIEIYPNIPTGLEGGMQALPPTEQ